MNELIAVNEPVSVGDTVALPVAVSVRKTTTEAEGVAVAYPLEVADAVTDAVAVAELVEELVEVVDEEDVGEPVAVNELESVDVEETLGEAVLEAVEEELALELPVPVAERDTAEAEGEAVADAQEVADGLAVAELVPVAVPSPVGGAEAVELLVTVIDEEGVGVVAAVNEL